MKIIISCCKSKNGNLFIHNGERINFVSRVNEIEHNNYLCVHPDDLIPNENIRWRALVEDQQGQNNNLLPAHELYRQPIYNALFQNYGNDLFIFSAGWGIVRADYKLPKYNVTFSQGPQYAKRNHNDIFNDFKQLNDINNNEPIILIAPKAYVLPFCQLTQHLPNEKIIVYKSAAVLINNPYLNNNNFRFLYYQTDRSTNWHYEFARRLINNEIEL